MDETERVMTDQSQSRWRVWGRISAIAVGLAVVVSSASVLAAVPEVITHQGRLTNLDGEPETGEVTLQFRIYDDETSGSVLWEDEKSVDLGDSGFYSVELGGESNPLTAQVLAGHRTYLGVSVNGGDELEPRIALNAVPYAAVAGHVPGLESMRGMSVFDAGTGGEGVLGEMEVIDGAYLGRGWRVTSSDSGADGEAPVWSVDAEVAGRHLSMSLAAVGVRMQVANNALGDRMVTFRCVAEREGQDQVLGQLHIAPDDFGESQRWEQFLIHCEFAPDDENQRVVVDAYEPNLTTLTVDYVWVKPLSDLPFILSWMILESQITERELAPNSVDADHLMDGSVTREAIAADAVGPGEMADAIEVYNPAPGCEPGVLLSSSCSTTVCGNNCGWNSDQTCYSSCGGGCPGGISGNTQSQTCSTEFIGYIMGPDAGN